MEHYVFLYTYILFNIYRRLKTYYTNTSAWIKFSASRRKSIHDNDYSTKKPDLSGEHSIYNSRGNNVM